jgi:hypothetical protein
MKCYVLAILLLGAVAALAGATPAAAQDALAITDVQAGYDGAYRLGDWFPVTMTIANDGPDVRGVVEWSFPGRDESTFRRAIDLPRGSRKRVTLDVFAPEVVRGGQIRLLDGSRVLIERNQPMEVVDQGRFLIGVVSSDPALLNSLNSLTLPSVPSTEVRHLDAATLPEHAASLRGINALFLHDVDTEALTQAQRDALALWVQLGGQLVVSGGGNGQRTAAGLAELLPAELAGGVSQGDLAPLASLGGTAPPDATATFSEARPREGAESLPADTPLLFRWRRGAGSVTFTTFDLASLRGWVGELRLWSQLLAPIDPLTPGFSARQRHLNLLQTALRLPSLGLPSAGTLFCFLIGYIAVIGPLNYLMLRRLRRLEWAWLTVPAGVLIFAAGLYFVGFGLRGGRSQVDQVAIVQSSEGQSRGFVTAFVGLFSPRRTSYTIGFPTETLISESSTWSELSSQSAPVLQNDASTEVPDVLVDVGSIRTFIAEGTLDVPVRVESDVRASGGQFSGQIHNLGAHPLEDALLIRGTSFQSLGTIAAGENRSLSSSAPAGNFPWGVSLPRTGLFDRQQLLSVLFENGPAGLTNPSSNSQTIDNSIYLLAWSSAPSVGVRLNGEEASQEGLTLYIIRLDDGAAGLPLTSPPTSTAPVPAIPLTDTPTLAVPTIVSTLTPIATALPTP